MSYRKRTKLDTTVFYAVGLSFKRGYSPFFLEKTLDSYDGFLPSAVKASFAFFAYRCAGEPSFEQIVT